MKPTIIHRGARIALVGRVNVGKSSLFNRIIGAPKALVSPIPGTTRDRNFAVGAWRGIEFTLIDTGGLDVGSGDIETNVRAQAEHAIEEADAIVQVADVTAGVHPEDRTLAKLLAATKKPVFLALNKSDNPRRRAEAREQEWYRLSKAEPRAISAANGSGIGDLLDAVLASLETRPTVREEHHDVSVAIIGKPNAGKSSLLNALVGEERAIVSPVPGTTREPADTTVVRDGKTFIFVDTVGIRKRARIGPGLEKTGVARSLAAIDKSDVVLLVVDPMEGITAQDEKLGALVRESGKAIIIVANKWDLIEGKTTDAMSEFERLVRSNLPGLDFAPIVTASALTGSKVPKLYDLILLAKANWERVLRRDELDAFFQNIVRRVPLRYGHGTIPKGGRNASRPFAYDLKQTDVRPPSFALAVRGTKTTLHESSLRAIQKKLQEQFKLVGTPVRVAAKAITITKK